MDSHTPIEETSQGPTMGLPTTSMNRLPAPGELVALQILWSWSLYQQLPSLSRSAYVLAKLLPAQHLVSVVSGPIDFDLFLLRISQGLGMLNQEDDSVSKTPPMQAQGSEFNL